MEAYWPLGRYIRTKTSEFAGGLELEKAPPDEKMLDLSKDIYADASIQPKQKPWTLREALIAKRYHQNRALAKRVDKAQQKENLDA